MHILIVEDEDTSRQSMESILTRQYPEITVHSAVDGEEALAKAELLHYDIVLADIQMPRMDGLAMLEALYRFSPSTLVIIISAYDYFYYAQRALQLGAFDYILKPFEEDRLLSSISRAITQLRKQPDITLPTVDGVIPPPETDNVRKYAAGYLRSAKWGRVLLLLERPSPKELPRSMQEWQELAAQVQVSAKSTLERQRWVFVKQDGSCLILLATLQDREQDSLEDLLEEIGSFVASLQQPRRPHLYLAVGTLDSMDSIALSQRHAQESAQYLFYDEKAYILWLPTLKTTFSAVTIGEHLARAVRENRREEVALHLRNAVEVAARERVVPMVFKQSMDQWLGAFIDEYRGMFLSVDSVKLSELRGKALAQDGAREYIRILTLLLTDISRLIGNFNSNKNAVLLEKCIEYIERNYANPDLSLQAITEHFYFNSSYFSTIFKKQTGKTIMQYLTMVRIDHAKKLLRNLDIRVNEVASRVGFSDMRYFMRVFKAETGLTPGAYRKQERGKLSH